ncbi:MAG: riboflavin biosynthesis protein [Meiothermus sp.]|uniref:Riboflavin biosynthesis protein n=2 Tax=Meiothermus hypogaeus TaxID=884155 RepID=A0A511R6A7_9DEIN|nr:riboflavin biosynthesis protein RibF [Meiothermus hypogaeus]RIH75025.1 Riboflavin biosynthesis protein RibF [Meiothermus hypogaeus]GEM85144.1 riboflavin biosynthesis protein [Meiothermus hypogaeus NBRC 106114]GIW37798.1 MAG: riboflavin biosynthesis protein [Meiothermus sp.]
MLLINDPSDAPAGPKVVAIGSFDGLHLGHQHLIHQAQQEAKNQHIPLLVYTFDPPSKVFMKGEGFLTDLSEKLELLRGLGVEIALIVPFTEAFSKRSKDDFLGDLRSLEAQRIFVGADFRFGQGRAGSLEDLNTVAPTQILPLLELSGGPVKSSRIRDLLREGEVDEAKLLLGRVYTARGIVQEGDKLGRRLGFPTANIEVAPLKILPMGVFAVRVQTPQGRFGGMANVGYRPTVSGQVLRFEVHLFGFTGDLYGQELSVEFLTKLRGEKKFESLEALKAQLAQDAEAARKVLGF